LWFQLLLISDIIFGHRPPDHGTHLDLFEEDVVLRLQDFLHVFVQLERSQEAGEDEETHDDREDEQENLTANPRIRRMMNRPVRRGVSKARG
jgi:hypothetical protein